jgi:hypothetical protein
MLDEPVAGVLCLWGEESAERGDEGQRLLEAIKCGAHFMMDTD